MMRALQFGVHVRALDFENCPGELQLCVAGSLHEVGLGCAGLSPLAVADGSI